MTIKQLWVQSEAYNAIDDRLALAAMLPAGDVGEYGSAAGVRSATDFVATMIDATTLTVSRGVAFVALGGSIYVAGSDADETLTISPADPTNARIDLVVLHVFDSEAGGADSPPVVDVVAGAPAASPVMPTVGDGELVLAQINVAANSTTPVLTDRRSYVQGGRPIAAMSSNSVVVRTGVTTGIAAYQLTTIPVRGFDYAAGVLTIKRSGSYRWAGTAYYVGVSTTPSHVRLVTMLVNGNTVPSYAGRQDIVIPANSRTSTIISGGSLVPLKAGDRCQLAVLHAGGVNISVAAFFTLMLEDAGTGRDADARAFAALDEPDDWWTDLPFEQASAGEDRVEFE